MTKGRRAADQAAGERAIFGQFVRASGLPVRLIESRDPPEPDIRCEIATEGPVAFELGEVVNEPLARATNERGAARREFRARYDALPAADRADVERCLGGPPVVSAGFVPGVPPGKWRQAAQVVLDTLVQRAKATGVDARLSEGEILVRGIPALQELLTDLEVRRSRDGRPFFGVLETTRGVDDTVRLLADKFGKRYKADAPIELLAYYVAAPPDDEPDWRASVSEFLTLRTPSSPFRRVWLYDGFAKATILVHPPYVSGSGEM